MDNKFDLYIDESCHLENDHIPVMCIGYIKVPHSQYSQLKNEFIRIAEKHNLNSELKWNKFSNARTDLYKELVDYFFNSPLQFRCVLIKNKSNLSHKDFNQGSHDNFYYHMMYHLLTYNIKDDNNYRVFIDVKDTRGREKLRKINEVIGEHYKGNSPFSQFQHLHSHDNVFFQLADFFIGAISYKARMVINDIANPTPSRIRFINYLENSSGTLLENETDESQMKFNIFSRTPN